MAEPTGEPQNKKQKIETEEEEEEQEEGCVEYKLFVAIEDTKGKPEKGDEEEEDIGSEDSDEDSEEEEEEGLLVYKWDDLNFGEDVLEKVKKMSSSLYDHSDEGFQEIEAATTKKAGNEKESEEEDDEEEKGNGELITLDKVDLAAMLVVKICKDKGTAEITQLFTDPEYRDRGVGNDLTNAALCFVQETYEVKHVDVFAVCGSGPFYKKVGFEYVSNEKGDSNDLAEDKDDSEQPERCIMRYTFSSGTQSTSEEEEEDDDDDEDGDEDDDDNEDEDDSENDNENDDDNDSDDN